MGSTLPGLPAASTRHSGTLPARPGVFPAQPLECGCYRRFDFTCPAFSPKRRVFDWRLRAEKPLLKSLSFLLKPLFRWNRGWAMARGEEGLRRELIRRRAVDG